jgi:hypothetical protein
MRKLYVVLSLIIVTFAHAQSPTALEGNYNVLVEVLNFEVGPYTFSNEPITSIAPNQYRTVSVGHFYPLGTPAGSANTTAVYVPGPQNYGYIFQLNGTNVVLDENQTAFQYWGNFFWQIPMQVAASVYDPSSGIIILEWSMEFPGGNRQYRTTYTPINIGVDSFSTDGMQFYPNPVKDVLNFTKIENETSYSIFNLLGQQVGGGALNTTSQQIVMVDFPAGTYLIKLQSATGSKTIKILKK